MYLNHYNIKMKKIFIVLFAAVVLSSCGTLTGVPGYGAVYQDVFAPAFVTSNPLGFKKAEGTVTSVLGLFSTGDASIQRIAKEAGISRISHVDTNTKSILGLFTTYTVIVYGD